MSRKANVFRRNLRLAQRLYPDLEATDIRTLAILSRKFQVELATGEIMRLDRSWYVTHAGLLALADRRGCVGIDAKPIPGLSNPMEGRYVVQAICYPTLQSRGFVGLGDASADNTGDAMRGAELRIAETRAVNRAIRKAYAVGVCSAEELTGARRRAPRASASLRTQLNAIICEHRLEAGAVKQLAVEYCGVSALSKATQRQVTDFLEYLKKRLKNDPDRLRCQLVSYPCMPASTL